MASEILSQVKRIVAFTQEAVTVRLFAVCVARPCSLGWTDCQCDSASSLLGMKQVKVFRSCRKKRICEQLAKRYGLSTEEVGDLEDERKWNVSIWNAWRLGTLNPFPTKKDKLVLVAVYLGSREDCPPYKLMEVRCAMSKLMKVRCATSKVVAMRCAMCKLMKDVVQCSAVRNLLPYCEYDDLLPYSSL